MLVSLTLKNFILIESLSLQFHKGFHVLTGETGAGKTLLLQAIHLLSGQKVNSDIIRSGEEKAILEAAFDIEGLPLVHSLLANAGIEFDPEEYLVIKREVVKHAKNRIFINSQMASHTLLSQIGPLLLKLIGQNSSNSLRKKEEQRILLDCFADLEEKVALFTSSYEEAKSLKEKIYQLQQEAPHLQLEKLKWEYEEWSNFSYVEGEEEELFEEYKRLASIREKSEKLNMIQEGLEHPSILSTLAQCKKLSESISQEALSAQLSEAVLNIQEASYLTSQALEEVEASPGRYEELENRLTTLNHLKKKYHLDSSEIVTRIEALEKKIDELDNLDEHIEKLQNQLDHKQKENISLSKILTKLRQEAANKLSARLSKELKELNLPDAQVVIQVQPKEIGPYGADSISIDLSVNKGEPLSSLQSKTSGGELSRFLLAATIVLAEKSTLPTLIFDEIDSNVGGKTATLLGAKLHKLGKTSQILAITHFSQVACAADHHFQISKIEKMGRTLTEIRPLDEIEISSELSRMQGGIEIAHPIHPSLSSTPG